MSAPPYAACIQTDFPYATTRNDIPARVDRMLEMAAHTVDGYEPFHDVRLLVYPEFAHTPPIYDTVAKLRDRLAVELPNEHTDRYAKFCKDRSVYIQTGTFLEVNPKYPGHVFNTTCLIGPTGILSTYRKVNPWLPWEVHSSPHDVEGFDEPIFPVVDTEIGKLGVAICYDWLLPETIRQIAFQGAEIIIRVSAYMDPWGATAPMDWWTLFNRARAAENTAIVVACNQGAQFKHYPPFSWPGASMIVDHDGRILAQADPGPGEKVVVAPIDFMTVRNERARRIGHDTHSHLRTEIHPYMRTPVFPPQHKHANGEEITIESIKERIDKARDTITDDLQ